MDNSRGFCSELEGHRSSGGDGFLQALQPHKLSLKLHQPVYITIFRYSIKPPSQIY